MTTPTNHTSDPGSPSSPPGGPPQCQIEGFALGPFETNCYLVYAGAREGPPGRECWIIDASFEPEAMTARIEALRLVPSMLILTHAHADHIAGVGELLSRFPACRLLIHQAEQEWLTDPSLNLSMSFGVPITTRPADRLLRDGEVLELDGLSWLILHTPGHSPGGITLYCEPAAAAIVGDALFAGSIGRTDFPGSDFDTLAAAIRARLYTLPEQTRIYPGHGPTSTIGREKMSNPFVRG
jgi:hydroxyacylglutathione hydrolase